MAWTCAFRGSMTFKFGCVLQALEAQNDCKSQSQRFQNASVCKIAAKSPLRKAASKSHLKSQWFLIASGLDLKSLSIWASKGVWNLDEHRSCWGVSKMFLQILRTHGQSIHHLSIGPLSDNWSMINQETFQIGSMDDFLLVQNPDRNLSLWIMPTWSLLALYYEYIDEQLFLPLIEQKQTWQRGMELRFRGCWSL